MVDWGANTTRSIERLYTPEGVFRKQAKGTLIAGLAIIKIFVWFLL